MNTTTTLPRPSHNPTRTLSALLGLLILANAAQAINVTGTLSWEPSTTPGVTYNVYQATGSAGTFYYVGNAASATSYVVTYDNGQLNKWYVTSKDASGLESTASNIVQKDPINPPPSGLTFEAESGQLAAPFYISGGIVQQDVSSGINDGGRATYTFNVATAGAYTLNMVVNAVDGAHDSLYVNIDAEPTDPANLWDIPNTSGLELRTLQWRNETNTHVFNLSAAPHNLVVRGREAGTQFDRISVVPLAGPPPVNSFALGAPVMSDTNLVMGETVNIGASIRNTGTAALTFASGGIGLIQGTNPENGAYVILFPVSALTVQVGGNISIGGSWFVTNIYSGLWNSYLFVKDASGFQTHSPLTAFTIATDVPPPTAPQPPQNVQGTVISRSRLKLSWYHPNANAVITTRIERKKGTESYKLVKTIAGGTTLTWTDTNIDRRREYWYRLQAVNGAGASAYSTPLYYKSP